jgi:hypothetical protein
MIDVRAAPAICFIELEPKTRALLIPVNATIGFTQQGPRQPQNLFDRNKIPLGACHDQYYDEFRL